MATAHASQGTCEIMIVIGAAETTLEPMRRSYE